ncbi:MAG: glycosyltransferase [Lachnospiraceae bacterium]|nr:glycosyltransferase [Lachnospiraceae bacterium]
MKILFLNTTYLCGGAEAVTLRIFQGMKERGHDVYEIVSYHKRPEKLPENVHVLYHGMPLLVLNRVLTRGHSNENLTIPYSRHAILRFIREQHIDVVHLHNAHGNFLGIDDIRAIAEVCPVVWTVHDFWPLTGHCTSPVDCPERWENGCAHCPHPEHYPPVRAKRAPALLEAKKNAFRGANIRFTVPSEWMRRQVLESHLKAERCVCIPNALDTACWTPCEKSELRRAYDIPEDKHIVGFVAADPQIKAKGMNYLCEALTRLSSPQDYLLLIAGKDNGLSVLSDAGFQTRRFGYIIDQEEMNRFYALCDILVNPSVYETFGLTTIEAMASGTPVIVFPICAMPEIVPPQAGWCLPEVSSAALAHAMKSAFSEPGLLAAKGAAAREHVLKNYSENKMLDAFEALYQEAVNAASCRDHS